MEKSLKYRVFGVEGVYNFNNEPIMISDVVAIIMV